MLSWPTTLLLIAVVASLISLMVLTQVALGIAKIFLVLSLVLLVISVLFGKRGV
jgi:uncharacterized membrane protein YtjA (UPF0391 family)